MASQINPKSVRARNLRQSAGKILVQLHLLMKLHQLYDAENQYIREAYESLGQQLDLLFKSESDLTLSIEDGYIIASGLRLRTERSAIEAHEWFLNRCAESGIEKVMIAGGTKSAEVRKFLPIFGKVVWAEQVLDPPPIPEELDKAYVSNIRVKMRKRRELFDPDEDDSEVSSQKLSMLLWFQLHTAASGLVTAIREGTPLPMRRARALMKLVVDLFLQEESALLAMTRMKYYVPEGRTTESPWEAYLESHMVNTSILALGLANRVGFDKRQLLDVGSAALAADVGMALVPLEVRDRPEPLKGSEREEVDRHVILSTDALLRADEVKAFNQLAAVVASEHHPRVYDLHREEKAQPSLFGSIVALADAYDAMTTDRPWRGAWPHAEAIPQLVRNQEGFDPTLAKALANLVGVFPAGTVVELDSGELATVVGVEGGRHPARPIVKLLVGQGGGDLRGEPIDLSQRSASGKYLRSIAKLVDLNSYAEEPGDLVALL